jgi:predicted nucleotidyltransferase
MKPKSFSRLKRIINQSLPLLKAEGITKAGIFGSYVRGDQRSDSDIDMLVKLKKGKSLLDLVKLELKLEAALGRKVDLLTYNSLHPLLKDIILKEEVRIL